MNFKKVLFLFLSVVVLQIESSTASEVGYNPSLQQMADLAHLAVTGPRNLHNFYLLRNYEIVDLIRPDEDDLKLLEGRIRYFLKHGKNPDAPDWDRNTALIKAAAYGYVDIVKILLEAGAVVDAQNNNGYTALVGAVSVPSINENCLKIVKILLEAGANPYIANNSGNTVLMKLAFFNNAEEFIEMLEEIIEKLKEWHVDFNVVNNNGDTALILAASLGNAKMVEMLLRAGASVDMQDNYGETALMAAMDAGHTEVANLLRIYGALDTRSIGRVFSGEPVLENYIKGDVPVESDEQALDAFNTDMQDYLVDRLQSAYSIFIDTRDPQPLIDFFCNEMWPIKGLMPMIFNSFKSKDHLQALLSFLRDKARTAQEKQRLQELQEIEAQLDATAAANALKSPMEIYKSI